MSFISHEKLFSRRWFAAYGQIVVGAALLAAGYVLFITPYKVVPGGVYGISIILHHLLGTPVGLTALAFNIPITILATRILGPRYGVKTITGFVLTAIFIDGLTYILGGDPLGIGSEVLMSSIYGGVFIGVGVGLLFRARASCGGTDVVSMMLSKYTGRPVGQLMITVDSLIVLLGFVFFGDWKIPLYSIVTIFVIGQVVDIVMQGISYNKCLLIVSDKHEEIGTRILHHLERGGTYFKARGLFSDKERPMIFTVMSRRETAILQAAIKDIDPKAFITVMDASEILGEGFRPLAESAD
ncbi:MAG: YitT family protein [Bacteroidales bacterium]